MTFTYILLLRSTLEFYSIKNEINEKYRNPTSKSLQERLAQTFEQWGLSDRDDTSSPTPEQNKGN